MDQLDEQIIDDLRRLGYQKSSVLARHLGKHQRTVRQRLNVLKNKGIIRVVAIPNPVRCGFNAWAHILILAKTGYLVEVARQLVEHPSTYFIAYCIGRFNLITTVLFENIEQLTQFVNIDLAGIDGIASTETLLITQPRKYYHFLWPEPVSGNNSNSQVYSFDHAPRENFFKLDAVDRAIIEVLMEDGLARPKFIKSKLGLGENTIRTRIKRMLRNDIFRIEVIPNLTILKNRIWITIGVVTDRKATHRVIDAVIDYQDVHGVASTFGRYDVVVSGAFKNVESLNYFVNGVISEIEGVNSVDTYILAGPLKYYKINWYHSYHLVYPTLGDCGFLKSCPSPAGGTAFQISAADR